MNAKKKSKDEPARLQAAKLVEVLYKSQYMDKKDFYLHSFFRGAVAGAGGILGATVLIAILLWILSLFDTVPLIGPLLENTRSTIEGR